MIPHEQKLPKQKLPKQKLKEKPQEEQLEEQKHEQKKSCKTFQDLFDSGLISAPTLEFTKSMNFSKMSPVQEAVIPVFVGHGQDVAVEACTGSGKTVAFLIPTLEMLMRTTCPKSAASCSVGAVCLAPTRELVVQIHQVLDKYLKFVNFSDSRPLESLLFTGGNDIAKDVEAIKDPSKSGRFHIIVATPGRFSHLLETLTLNVDWTFRDLEVLVFDEADRLLLDRASFERQLSAILAVLPKQRRTGLFSATLSSEMKSILKAGMRNPMLIRVVVNQKEVGSETIVKENGDVSAPSIPQRLTNYYAMIERQNKFAFLLKFLLTEIFPPPAPHTKTPSAGKKCILFFLTCSCVNFFHKLIKEAFAQNVCPWLSQATVVERLYGKMSQKTRTGACERFLLAPPSNGALLVATDVAARGLDFPDVDWIVQFDAPLDPAMFVHRIGRTARAGKAGQSLLLVCPPEDTAIPFLQNRQVNLVDVSEHPTLLESMKSLNLSSKIKLPSNKQGAPPSSECPEELPEREDVLQIEYSDFKKSWELFRCMLTQDRDRLLSGSSAFVSYIRAYKEHQLQFIFPFKDLEIGQLASSLGLLRIPRVQEILGKPVTGFKQSSQDPSLIPFKDKHRAAEHQLVRERKKQAREEKPINKQTKTIVEGEEEKNRTRSEKRRTKRRRRDEEWDELALEERLFKKLRRGKISEQEYEKRLAVVEDEGDENDMDEEPAAEAAPRWSRAKRKGGRKR